MSRKTKIIILKQYKDVLEYLKRFDLKEEVKSKENPKVLVLTKKRNGKLYKVA